jgi:hypothetical protein
MLGAGGQGKNGQTHLVQRQHVDPRPERLNDPPMLVSLLTAPFLPALLDDRVRKEELLRSQDRLVSRGDE